MRAKGTAVLLLAAGLAAVGGDPRLSADQPAKLKVHISVDMEGIAGVVTGEQLGPTGFEYGRFREFMTSATTRTSATGPRNSRPASRTRTCATRSWAGSRK